MCKIISTLDSYNFCNEYTPNMKIWNGSLCDLQTLIRQDNSQSNTTNVCKFESAHNRATCHLTLLYDSTHNWHQQRLGPIIGELIERASLCGRRKVKIYGMRVARAVLESWSRAHNMPKVKRRNQGRTWKSWESKICVCQISTLQIHFKLHNITFVAMKVHVMFRSFVVLTWMRDQRNLV